MLQQLGYMKYTAPLYNVKLTNPREGRAHWILDPRHPLLLRGQKIILPHLKDNSIHIWLRSSPLYSLLLVGISWELGYQFERKC